MNKLIVALVVAACVNAMAAESAVMRGKDFQIRLINEACKNLPSGKAPAPFRFRANFLKAGESKPVEGCARGVNYGGEEMVIIFCEDGDMSIVPGEAFVKEEAA
jgi:hypothetical protein